MIIDGHQHFWSLARGDYGWLTPDLAAIHRDFAPDDLSPLLMRSGIDRSILVQAAPTREETEFLLDIARDTPFVAGVVGWTDFDDPEASAEIAAMADNRLLVGLRPMVHDIADETWLARPELSPAIKAMSAHGLVFDALLRPRHIPAFLAMMERHPELPVVVDHAAKPDLAGGDLTGWQDGITAIARRTTTFCKLSGLVTEASEHWTPQTLRLVIDHLLASFGPQRLIWGSDWPVVTLRTSYADWFDTATDLLASLSQTERDSVFGGNARELYLTSRGRR